MDRLKNVLPLLAVAAAAAGTAPAQTLTDFFDDSVLHEIRITMSASNFQGLKDHYLDNTYFTVDSLQWKGAGSNTLTISNIAVRSRGHGSRNQNKIALHVDINHNVTTQRFLGLTEFDLKSNTQDPSLIHERLSMEMFTRMGVPASREVSTRVYINGNYIGVYNIVESPDSAMLTRLFGENNGFLYEYKPGDWMGVSGFGWHFEYLPGTDLERWSSSVTPTPFDPQVPHTNSPDTVTLDAMFDAINRTSDANFVSEVSKFLDFKPWLTHVAVETYLADFDCILGDIFGTNNFFLYRFQNKQLSKFIAWDKDNAFAWTQRPILQNANQNVLMRRLMAIPEYKSYYFDALAKTAMQAGGSGGWLEHEVSRMYNQIRQAAYEDNNKTYLDSGQLLPSSNDKFDTSVALLTSFAAERTRFVTGDLATQGYQTPSSYPLLADGGVLNAGGISAPAAGGLATIYGSNMGDGKDTQVYVNGFQAPVVFASPGQYNVQAPWEATGFAPFGMIVNGAPSNLQFSNVATHSPGIFVVTHTNFTPVLESSPAAANEVLIVWATGLGPVNGAMVTGQPASLTSLQSTLQPVTAAIGNIPATVVFAGLSPGFIGLYQVTVQLPGNAPSGSALTISAGGQSTSVLLPVK